MSVTLLQAAALGAKQEPDRKTLGTHAMTCTNVIDGTWRHGPSLVKEGSFLRFDSVLKQSAATAAREKLIHEA